MSKITRQLKYKTLKSKQNIKRSLMISGGISLGVIVFGLSVSVPVYISIRNKLLSAVGGIFDIQKVLRQLATMLGLTEEELLEGGVTGGEWTIESNSSDGDGTRLIIKHIKTSKTIILSLNANGGLVSAGSLSGPAAKEILAAIEDIKNSLGEKSDAINDILDTVGKNAEYSSLRIEANVLKPRIRNIIGSNGKLSKDIYNGLSGENVLIDSYIAVIASRNAYASGVKKMDAEFQALVDAQGTGDTSYKSLITAQTVESFKEVAKELVLRASLDTEETKKEYEAALKAAKEQIDEVNKSAADREKDLVDSVKDIKNEAEANAVVNDPSKIDNIVKSPTSWITAYVNTFGYKPENREPLKVIRTKIMEKVVEHYNTPERPYSEQEFLQFMTPIIMLLGLEAHNDDSIATSKIRLNYEIIQKDMTVYSITTNIQNSDKTKWGRHHIGVIKDNNDKISKMEYIDSSITTITDTRSRRLVSFNELMKIYYHGFEKVKISSYVYAGNKWVKSEVDQISAKLTNKIHNIINNPSMNFAWTFNTEDKDGVYLNFEDQAAAIDSMINNFNSLTDPREECFYHELFLRNIDDYLFNGKWIKFSPMRELEIIKDYRLKYPANFDSNFKNYAARVRAALGGSGSIAPAKVDYLRLKYDYPFDLPSGTTNASKYEKY